jgi:hypothetical protein
MNNETEQDDCIEAMEIMLEARLQEITQEL